MVISTCVHWWIVSDPSYIEKEGMLDILIEVTHQVCKHCGAERDNYVDVPVWEEVTGDPDDDIYSY